MTKASTPGGKSVGHAADHATDAHPARGGPVTCCVIWRRLLLIIPTLVIILLVNFVIMQAAPGGPVEQAIAHLQGIGGHSMSAAVARRDAMSGTRAQQPWPRPATDQGHRKPVRLRQTDARTPVADAEELRATGFRQQLLSRRHGHRPDPGKDAGDHFAGLVGDADHLPGVDPAGHSQSRAPRQRISMSGAARRSSSATRCRRFCLRCS